MDEQDEVVSQKYILMVNIAFWAKKLAWVAFVCYFILMFSTYIRTETYYKANVPVSQTMDFIQYMAANPLYGTSVLVSMLSSLVRGFVYFLVLQGISLGLNMIVETDVNYRNREEETNEQRAS